MKFARNSARKTKQEFFLHGKSIEANTESIEDNTDSIEALEDEIAERLPEPYQHLTLPLNGSTKEFAINVTKLNNLIIFTHAVTSGPPLSIIVKDKAVQLTTNYTVQNSKYGYLHLINLGGTYEVLTSSDNNVSGASNVCSIAGVDFHIDASEGITLIAQTALSEPLSSDSTIVVYYN